MIRCLVEYAILEPHTQNVEYLAIDDLVALELNVGFELADLVVCVALVDGRNPTLLLVVPRILLTVGLDDFFYGEEENYAINFLLAELVNVDN